MMSPRAGTKWRDLPVALLFLAPNLLGFLAFTFFPLFYSLLLAFSDKDLRSHNIFHSNTAAFIGLRNFERVMRDPDFWRFFGNTWFLMLGMPVGIAASLIAALLLSKDLKAGGTRVWLAVAAGALGIASFMILAAVGEGASGMFLLLITVGGAVLVLGATVGNSVYRTLFYIPNFISGVATYLLWKKLYNPQTGPISSLLRPPLAALSWAVFTTNHPFWFTGVGQGLLLISAASVFLLGVRRLRGLLANCDLSAPAAVVPIFFLCLPLVFIPNQSLCVRYALLVLATIFLWVMLTLILSRTESPRIRRWEGLGSAVVYSWVFLLMELILLGLALVVGSLPAMVHQNGTLRVLEPPDWLNSTAWAKPSLMIMAFWGAVGSNTMLLYLAALTGIPPELYEAADIDGAGRFVRFWHIVWPQLAPTTFFVVVMGMVTGLQGGFEMARAMTNGGPAGSTTSLSYFIYNQAFVLGRLGYSSAVAWLMFLMVLFITIVNVKFGNKYINE